MTEKPWKDSDLLRELYIEDELSTVDISEMFGCTAANISYWLKRHGIETRSISEGKVVRNRRNPARLYTNANAYEICVSASRGERKKFVHHRLIAVAEYGLDSVRGNVVHHKNGIKWDNRPSNLELMSPSDHGKRHNSRGYSWLEELKIREMAKVATNRVVAEQFDVGNSTVANITNDKGSCRFSQLDQDTGPVNVKERKD